MYTLDIIYPSGSKMSQRCQSFAEVNQLLCSINDKITVEIRHDLYFSRQTRENGQLHRLDGPAVYTTTTSIHYYNSPVMKESTSISYYLNGVMYINTKAWLEEVMLLQFKTDFKDMMNE